MNGILLIDKPAGWTSFDVIGKLRGVLHMRRLGHAGTLDPMATGVLPVFVGYATKACGILPDERKAYTASFRLGCVSNTQDSTGEITPTGADLTGLTADRIEKAVPVGSIQQIPPMYSAVKVGGRKLYELARKGEEIERTPRSVYVERVSCTGYDPATGTGTVRIQCGKGTYVRTLLHDMGQALGCGAVMTGLRRDMACGFLLDDCHTIAQVQEAPDPEALLIPTAAAFESLPRVELTDRQTALYRNGVKLALDTLKTPYSGRCAVYGSCGFLGTALPEPGEGFLRMERNLCPPGEARV